MNTDFRQYIAKPVIRLEDIAALRMHIEQKYPGISPAKRAELMAQSIHKMLDTSMIGLESDHKNTIKKRLISDNLIESRQSVLKMDVLNSIFSLNAQPEQLLSKAWGWYVLNTGHSITMADFTTRTTPYMPHSLRHFIQDSHNRSQSFREEAAQKTLHSKEGKPFSSEILEDNQGFNLKKALSTFLTRFKSHLKSLIPQYRLTRRGYICIGGFLAGIASIPMITAANITLPETFGTSESVYASPLSQEAVYLFNQNEIVPPIPVRNITLDKPEYFKYQNISIEKLKYFLSNKQSMLLKDNYLDELLSYCCEKDINPLLMIAILGQEQNYVPQLHPHAEKIMKNPFNIYGSWETHPVGFTDSMKEACYKVNNDLKNRLYSEDPFEVLNRKYAQDPNWFLGVKTIFKDLNTLCGTQYDSTNL